MKSCCRSAMPDARAVIASVCPKCASDTFRARSIQAVAPVRHIFIDGTKIESAANRYTFVWKKAVTKNQKRLCDWIAVFVEECELLYGIRFIFNGKRFGLRTLKKIWKKLYKIKA